MPTRIFSVASSLALMLVAAPFAAHAAEPIVVYTNIGSGKALGEVFTTKTGTPVDVVQLSTGEVLGKVSAEGNNPKYDVLWIEGSAAMTRLADEGVLKAEKGLADKADYTDLGRRLVPASQAFFPITVSTTAIAYNTEKLKGEEPPKSWADLKRFAGAVAAKDPNLSGPAYQWLAGLFEVFGADNGKALLGEVLTNKALSGLPGSGDVNKALITGNAKVAVQQDTGIYGLIAKNEPVAVAYPTDGVAALPSCAGVSSNTRHEDSARAFIQFLLTADADRTMQAQNGNDSYFAPLINGVTPKGARVDNTASWQIIDDKVGAAHEAEWKAWFRDSFVP